MSTHRRHHNMRSGCFPRKCTSSRRHIGKVYQMESLGKRSAESRGIYGGGTEESSRNERTSTYHIPLGQSWKHLFDFHVLSVHDPVLKEVSDLRKQMLFTRQASPSSQHRLKSPVGSQTVPFAFTVPFW